MNHTHELLHNLRYTGKDVRTHPLMGHLAQMLVTKVEAAKGSL